MTHSKHKGTLNDTYCTDGYFKNHHPWKLMIMSQTGYIIMIGYCHRLQLITM